MTKNMVNKVIKANGKLVSWGRYTYRIDVNTGVVYRTLTSDLGRIWVDENGVFDSWSPVGKA